MCRCGYSGSSSSTVSTCCGKYYTASPCCTSNTAVTCYSNFYDQFVTFNAASDASHRIAANGYRIAVNTDSCVSVAFTGSFTNNVVVTDSPFKNFRIGISYTNLSLVGIINSLSDVLVSLPYTATGDSSRYLVPVSLDGLVALGTGNYQFDVTVYPVTYNAITGKYEDSEGDFDVDGFGNLAITVDKKYR